MRAMRDLAILASLLSIASTAKAALLPTTVLNSASAQSSILAVSLNDVKLRKMLLVFTEYGREIPKSEVENTFRAAEIQIETEVDAHPDQPIPLNGFEYRREGGEMVILIQPYAEEEISWKELSRVMLTLYRFMTGGAGVPQKHYQTLEFRVEVIPAINIGSGLIWYFGPDRGITQKRANVASSRPRINRDHVKLVLDRTTEAQMSQLPRTKADTIVHSKPASNAMPSLFTTSTNSVVWPIDGTDITLIFTFFGLEIPSTDIYNLIVGAVACILPAVQQEPFQVITENNFRHISDDGQAGISLVSYPYKYITWLDLSQILTGLLHFCNADHNQVLVFEIDIEGQGRAGFGTLLYGGGIHKPAAIVERSVQHYSTAQILGIPEAKAAAWNQALTKKNLYKRAEGANETLLQLPTDIANDSFSSYSDDCIVISDMGLQLCIRFLGQAIPRAEVHAMFEGAFTAVEPFYLKNPHDQVPNNFFRYTRAFSTDENRISILLQGSQRATIVWLGLCRILSGLWMYMAATRSGIPDQKEHFQTLAFNLTTFGGACMGTGYIQLTSSQGTTEKRTIVDDDALRLTAPMNQTLSNLLSSTGRSSSAVGATSPHTIPIADTQMTMLFYFFSSHVAGLGIEALSTLHSARSSIVSQLEDIPNIPINNHAFRYSKRFGSRKICIQIWASPYTITWRDLDDILNALTVFMQQDTETGNPCDQGSQFLINAGKLGSIAQGKLWWSTEAQVLEARAEAGIGSSQLHNSSLQLPTSHSPQVAPVAVPYPISDTPLTLSINDIGNTIHDFGRDASYVLVGARLRIMQTVSNYPNESVTNNRYSYHEEHAPNVSTFVMIMASGNHHLTWLEVDDILLGLVSFMSGDAQTGVAEHDKAVMFGVGTEGGGSIAYGSLWAVDSVTTSVAKRDTPPSTRIGNVSGRVNDTLIATSTSDTISPSVLAHPIDAPSPTSYPVPEMTFELSIFEIGSVTIAHAIVEALFDGAKSSFNSELASHPNGTMTLPYFFFSTRGPDSEMLSISVHNGMHYMLTWWQLSQILFAIQEFMERVGTEKTVEYQVLDTARSHREVGFGLLHYSTRGSGSLGVIY